MLIFNLIYEFNWMLCIWNLLPSLCPCLLELLFQFSARPSSFSIMMVVDLLPQTRLVLLWGDWGRIHHRRSWKTWSEMWMLMVSCASEIQNLLSFSMPTLSIKCTFKCTHCDRDCHYPSRALQPFQELFQYKLKQNPSSKITLAWRTSMVFRDRGIANNPSNVRINLVQISKVKTSNCNFDR